MLTDQFLRRNNAILSALRFCAYGLVWPPIVDIGGHMKYFGDVEVWP
jgi:hypothetical protein